MTDIEPAQLLQRLQSGDRRALARALTLAESTEATQRRALAGVLALAPAHPMTQRVAISGPPGAGKSTLIEALGKLALADARRVAVLAVDPSSHVSGGSLLADKTRMPTLSNHERAFVRPSPSRGHLGGVTEGLAESITLFEIAGYDLILVETVGVGQSELEAAQLVDDFVLVLSPQAGDELQALKRGITEAADLIVINKVDADPRSAQTMQRAYESALGLLTPHTPAAVSLVSATAGQGVDELYAQLRARFESTSAEERTTHRSNKLARLFRGRAERAVLKHYCAQPQIQRQLVELAAQVQTGAKSLDLALHELLEQLP